MKGWNSKILRFLETFARLVGLLVGFRKCQHLLGYLITKSVVFHKKLFGFK